MKASIDRFEGQYVICQQDNGEIVELDRERLPEGAKPGDIIDIDGDRIVIDAEETQKRKKNIAALVDDLFD